MLTKLRGKVLIITAVGHLAPDAGDKAAAPGLTQPWTPRQILTGFRKIGDFFIRMDKPADSFTEIK